MIIYTRAGDEGDTTGAGGRRVRKSDPLLEAVGTVDELSSNVGLCLAAAASTADDEIAAALQPVQAELLALGGALAGVGTEPRSAAGPDAGAVARMERTIDEVSAKLEPLDQFVLPAGCELAGRLHVARTVCRRAERRVVAAADGGTHVPPEALKYLNRLGDLLFVLARLANRNAGVPDAEWRPEST